MRHFSEAGFIHANEAIEHQDGQHLADLLLCRIFLRDRRFLWLVSGSQSRESQPHRRPQIRVNFRSGPGDQYGINTGSIRISSVLIPYLSRNVNGSETGGQKKPLQNIGCAFSWLAVLTVCLVMILATCAPDLSVGVAAE